MAKDADNTIDVLQSIINYVKTKIDDVPKTINIDNSSLSSFLNNLLSMTEHAKTQAIERSKNPIVV